MRGFFRRCTRGIRSVWIRAWMRGYASQRGCLFLGKDRSIHPMARSRHSPTPRLKTSMHRNMSTQKRMRTYTQAPSLCTHTYVSLHERHEKLAVSSYSEYLMLREKCFEGVFYLTWWLTPAVLQGGGHIPLCMAPMFRKPGRSQELCNTEPISIPIVSTTHYALRKT